MGYREIADEIAEKIRSGQFERGAKLPTSRELAATHEVAFATVRRALAALRADGLIETRPGSGSYVRDYPQVTRIARQRFRKADRFEGLASYLAEAAASGRSAKVEVLHIGLGEPAPDWVSDLLGLPKGEPVLVRYRRYLADGYPDQIATSYIPWSLAEGSQMVEENPGPGGIYARLEDRGHALTKFSESVQGRRASADERELLALSEGDPVLVVRRVAYSEAAPMEVCHQVKSAERWSLLYEWDVVR